MLMNHQCQHKLHIRIRQEERNIQPETRILRNLGLQLAELTLDRSDFKGSFDTQEIVQVCNTAGDSNG